MVNNLEPEKGYVLERAPGLLLVNDTPKGRGIFASRPISRNTVIETSPVLVFTPDEVNSHTSQTCLAHYTFNWPSPTGSGPQSQAIALGLGSMFNHSRLRQNVVWRRDVEKGVIVYSTCKDIEQGEELCISYGNVLWFPDAEAEDEDEKADEIGWGGLGNIEVVKDEDEEKTV